VLAYAWVTAGLRPFTLPALVAIMGGGAVTILVGVRLPPVTAATRSGATGGAWGWSALAGAIAVWELQSFLQHPRGEHPTLSSLTTSLLQSHPSRMVSLLVWIGAGVWLARRWTGP
jgi:hypothetical protein